jgi:lysophospholipase L1-like esterase
MEQGIESTFGGVGLSRWIRATSIVAVLSVVAVVMVSTTTTLGGGGSTPAPANREVAPLPIPQHHHVSTEPPSSPRPESVIVQPTRTGKCVPLSMSNLNILCFGDSLTFGNGSRPDPPSTPAPGYGNYPMELKGMLQAQFLGACKGTPNLNVSWVDVFNLGLNGVTICNGPRGYVRTRNWRVGKRFAPNAQVAVVLLGTNDSIDKLWEGKSALQGALQTYVDDLRTANPLIHVVVVTPPPILPDLLRVHVGAPMVNVAYYVTPWRVRQEINPVIRLVAEGSGRNVHHLDLLEVVRARFPELEPIGDRIKVGNATSEDIAYAKLLLLDGLHPTPAFSRVIAEAVYDILNKEVFPHLVAVKT